MRMVFWILAVLSICYTSCFFDSSVSLCAGEVFCAKGWQCAENQAICVQQGGCGNGVIDKNELCDDGNVVGGDRCSADCTSLEVCGNGIIDVAVGEACDDGDQNSSGRCNALCQLESCGNRIFDPGEACDTGGVDTEGCDFDCTLPRCGDGHFNQQSELH